MFQTSGRVGTNTRDRELKQAIVMHEILYKIASSADIDYSVLSYIGQDEARNMRVVRSFQQNWQFRLQAETGTPQHHCTSPSYEHL